jgi:uncharacterized protein (TIGR02996 family)
VRRVRRDEAEVHLAVGPWLIVEVADQFPIRHLDQFGEVRWLMGTALLGEVVYDTMTSVTGRDALHSAILDDPSDDTARLVLADLLRESDDPDTQARGRFLWAGVTASRFRDHEVIEDSLYYTATGEIAAIASAGHPALWFAELGLTQQPLTKADWAWDNTYDRVAVRVGGCVATFTRGMLAELAVMLEDWYSVAAVALAGWPVERVAIADVPGLAFAVEPQEHRGRGWRLAARLRVPRRNVPMAGPRVVPTAVSPLPFLVEEKAEWRAEEPLPDREALVAGIVPASASLVADLREAAGDRWPSPPFRRK